MQSVRQRPMRPTPWVAALFTLAVTWTTNVDDVHAAPKRKGAKKITTANKKASSSSAQTPARAPGQPETMGSVPQWDGPGSYAFGKWTSDFASVFEHSYAFQNSYKTPQGDVAWPLPLKHARFEIADVLSDGWCSLYAVNAALQAALQAARDGRPSPLDEFSPLDEVTPLDEFFSIHDMKISADGGDPRPSGASASSSRKPEALRYADVFSRRGEIAKEQKGAAGGGALLQKRREALTEAIDTTRRDAVVEWLLENANLEIPIKAFAHPAGKPVTEEFPVLHEYNTVDEAFALKWNSEAMVWSLNTVDSEVMGFLAQKLKRDIIVFVVDEKVSPGECPEVRTYRHDNQAEVVDEARFDHGSKPLFVLYRGSHFYALKPPQNFTHADYLQMLARWGDGVHRSFTLSDGETDMDDVHRLAELDELRRHPLASPIGTGGIHWDSAAPASPNTLAQIAQMNRGAFLARAAPASPATLAQIKDVDDGAFLARAAPASPATLAEIATAEMRAPH